MSEELLIIHAAPTLAGLKTGSLFPCPYEDAKVLKKALRAYNRRLAAKGICLLPLQMKNGRALIYVFRPKLLRQDLAREGAERLLAEYGYTPSSPSKCLQKMRHRFELEEFPHEVGLFLGYPPADVRAFIENGAKGACAVGAWKVYSNVAEAERRFAKYRKCTGVYRAQYARGATLDRLVVAARDRGA